MSPNTTKSSNEDNSYVAIGAIDKNFTIKNPDGKYTAPHATIHSNNFYHITKNKGEPISTAFNGGLGPEEAFEPWLEFNSNIINSLQIETKEIDCWWVIPGITDQLSVLLTVDIAKKVIFENNRDKSRFINLEKLILRLKVEEIPAKPASMQMFHRG